MFYYSEENNQEIRFQEPGIWGCIYSDGVCVATWVQVITQRYTVCHFHCSFLFKPSCSLCRAISLYIKQNIRPTEREIRNCFLHRKKCSSFDEIKKGEKKGVIWG